MILSLAKYSCYNEYNPFDVNMILYYANNIICEIYLYLSARTHNPTFGRPYIVCIFDFNALNSEYYMFLTLYVFDFILYFIYQ